MAPATEAPQYSPDPRLSPKQHHVLALVASGHSLSHAAQAIGVHRNTICNWRRATPAFAREIEFAMREQALVWRDRAVDLAPRASQVLSEILDNPDTAPALKLRAALAILKLASTPPPSLQGFSTPVFAEMEASHGQLLSWHSPIVHNRENANDAQSCTIRRAPEPGANSQCGPPHSLRAAA